MTRQLHSKKLIGYAFVLLLIMALRVYVQDTHIHRAQDHQEWAGHAVNSNCIICTCLTTVFQMPQQVALAASFIWIAFCFVLPPRTAVAHKTPSVCSQRAPPFC